MWRNVTSTGLPAPVRAASQVADQAYVQETTPGLAKKRG